MFTRRFRDHKTHLIYQGGRYAGARVRNLVRLVDVLRTLAERIGFRFDPPGFTAPGRSLWPPLRAPWWPRADTTLFAQRRPPMARSARTGSGASRTLRAPDARGAARLGYVN